MFDSKKITWIQLGKSTYVTKYIYIYTYFKNKKVIVKESRKVTLSNLILIMIKNLDHTFKISIYAKK